VCLFVSVLLAANVSADVNCLPVVRETRARGRADEVAAFRGQYDPPELRSRRTDSFKKEGPASEHAAQEDQVIIRADCGAGGPSKKPLSGR
jgi:hypothetical protein